VQGGEFTPHMQRVLVHLCIEDRSVIQLIQQLESERLLAFTDPTAAWGWATLTRLERPTRSQLENESLKISQGDPSRIHLLHLLGEPVYSDMDYVHGNLIDFARIQTYRAAFDEAAQLWNRGEHQQSMDYMSTRIDEIRRLGGIGVRDETWYAETYEDRWDDRRMGAHSSLDQVPTGIELFDRALGGGARRGATHVWLAYSGVGKSFALVDQGVGALRMRQRVAHFVLEGGSRYILERYDAAFTGLKTSLIRRGDVDRASVERVMNELRLYKKNLVLRGTSDLRGQPDISWFYAELDRLKDDENFIPDVLVIDYGDLISAEGKDERVTQIRAWEGVHKLGEYRISPRHPGWVMWSATQAVRPNPGADEREHWLYPRDIGEAWGKVKPCEFIASINRTSEEKVGDRARVMIGKNRFGAEGVRVRVSTNYSMGRFIDPLAVQEAVGA